MTGPGPDRLTEPAEPPLERSIVDLPALAFIIGLLVLGVAAMLLMVHR